MEDVSAGEDLFIRVGGFVVVVDEPALADLEIEEPSDPRAANDALRGPADPARIFQPPLADAVFEREEFRLGLRDELGGPVLVAAVSFQGSDHNTSSPIDRDFRRGAVRVGHRHPLDIGCA